ncbi:MAG: hypothetical protein R3C11_20135 [Planctomycetaceae bacterium]
MSQPEMHEFLGVEADHFNPLVKMARWNLRLAVGISILAMFAVTNVLVFQTNTSFLRWALQTDLVQDLSVYDIVIFSYRVSVLFNLLLGLVFYFHSIAWVHRASLNINLFSKQPRLFFPFLMICLAAVPAGNILLTFIYMTLLYQLSHKPPAKFKWFSWFTFIRSIVLVGSFALLCLITFMLKTGPALGNVYIVLTFLGMYFLLMCGMVYGWSSMVFAVTRLQEINFQSNQERGLRVCEGCGEAYNINMDECPVCGKIALEVAENVNQLEV